MAGNPNPVPFKKTGADANPNGRPKREWTWSGLYEDAMEKHSGDGKQKVKEVIATKLAQLAARGDVVAIKELANRMDGMPKQNLEIEGEVKIIPILGGHALPSNDGDQKALKAE